MSTIMQSDLQWLEIHPNLFHIVILVCTAIVINLVSLLTIHILLKHFRSKKIAGMQYFLEALRRPLIIYIWYLAALYAIAALCNLFTISDLFIFNKFAYAGFFIMTGWFAFRLIRYYEKRLNTIDKVQHLDRTTADGVIKLIRISVMVILALSLLQISGVPLTAIYTAAGGMGIGLTLAAQDLLKNFFGGVVLYFDRPFSISDRIIAVDNSFDGRVEKIGWRTTKIITTERRPLYIPNATFLTLGIQNDTRRINRRINTSIQVNYDDSSAIRKIVNDVETMLREHDDIEHAETLWVALTHITADSLNLDIVAYTKTIDSIKFQHTQQDILLKIIDIVEKHDAKMSSSNMSITITDPVDINLKNKEEK